MGSAAEQKARECRTPRIAPRNAPLEGVMLLTIRADPYISVPIRMLFWRSGAKPVCAGASG